MPLAYQIDRQQGLVSITGDYADADEWVALLNAVVEDPHFRVGLNFVRDLRGIAHRVNLDMVIRSISIVRELWNRLGARRAAVVAGEVIDPPTLIGHALADYHQIPVRVFTSYEDALKWLQAPDGPGGRQSP